MRDKDQQSLEAAYHTINEALRPGFAAKRNAERFPMSAPKPKVDSNQEMAKRVLDDLFVYFERQGKQDQFRDYIHRLDDEGLLAAYDDWNNEHISGVGDIKSQVLNKESSSNLHILTQADHRQVYDLFQVVDRMIADVGDRHQDGDYQGAAVEALDRLIVYLQDRRNELSPD
jgi:hypothetical protein